MIVIRNTYPVIPKVAHAEVGDIVEWTASRGKMLLVRQSDRATVFSRDCLQKEVEDHRPMVGVIAEIKSKGWVLEIEKGRQP